MPINQYIQSTLANTLLRDLDVEAGASNLVAGLLGIDQRGFWFDPSGIRRKIGLWPHDNCAAFLLLRQLFQAECGGARIGRKSLVERRAKHFATVCRDIQQRAPIKCRRVSRVNGQG
ncbi:hypothetical protein D9M71_609400 [compost metagenome]